MKKRAQNSKEHTSEKRWLARLCRKPLLLGTSFLSFALINCQVSVAPREAKIKDGIHADSDLSANLQQIRLKMRSLVDPMCGQVESAADQIIATSSDPSIKRAAVEWKSEAVPALRESLYEPGPLRALFDTWVFTNQMAAYYSTGPGAAQLGNKSSIAVQTSQQLERQVSEVAAALTKSGDVSKARAAARTWASAHPITTRIAHRESALAQASEGGPSDAFTATETLNDITMTVDDLNRKLEVYTDQLLRQVRWQAELISMDIANQYQLDQAMPLATRAVDSVDEITASASKTLESVDGALDQLDQAMPMLERMVVVAETAPELISTERSAAIGAVQEELLRMIQFVREEREAALQHVTDERLAALEALHGLLIVEREILTEDVGEISTEAIDHAFWRATQLVAAVVLVLLLAALVGLGLIRKMIVDILERGPAPVSG